MPKPQPTALEAAMFEAFYAVTDYLLADPPDESDAIRLAIISEYQDKYGDVCAQCGCTPEHACAGGCSWANAEHTPCDNPSCIAQAEKASEIAAQLRKAAA